MRLVPVTSAAMAMKRKKPMTHDELSF